jgi:hypothetical protein
MLFSLRRTVALIILPAAGVPVADCWMHAALLLLLLFAASDSAGRCKSAREINHELRVKHFFVVECALYVCSLPISLRIPWIRLRDPFLLLPPRKQHERRCPPAAPAARLSDNKFLCMPTLDDGGPRASMTHGTLRFQIELPHIPTTTVCVLKQRARMQQQIKRSFAARTALVICSHAWHRASLGCHLVGATWWLPTCCTCLF